MTGTELEIVPPARSEIIGADAERLPTLHTTAKSDADLVAVWIKSHADGSAQGYSAPRRGTVLRRAPPRSTPRLRR